MNLTWRPMTGGDIPACHPLVLDRFVYDDDSWRQIPALWRELLTTGYAESAVIEDRDRPPGSQMVGFCLLVFLTNDFVTAAKGCLPPYINLQILKRWRNGNSPILNREAVRRANSGPGLNLLVFHEWVELFSEFNGAGRPVREKAIQVFFEMGAGYRLKEMLIEVYGDVQKQFNLNGGLQVRRDYGTFFERGVPLPAPVQRPFLLGLTRDEAHALEGSAMSLFFSYSAPQFFLRRGEQEMLRYALLGQTDGEIAATLSLAPATLKKRWLSVYERVSSQDHDLLPAGAGQEQTRGLGKKQRLLDYLRAHPEELRPIIKPKGECLAGRSIR